MYSHLKAQFKSGDQAVESRKAFYTLHFKQCIKCASERIKEDRIVDNCRMNGDAYGTTTFVCELLLIHFIDN